MLKFCYACNATHPAGQRCPNQRNGSTRQWRTKRQQILTRDGHTCQRCGAHATHVDHIEPHAMGGNDNGSNLQALCEACNLEKGNA